MFEDHQILTELRALRRDVSDLRAHLDLRLNRSHERQSKIMAIIDDIQAQADTLNAKVTAQTTVIGSIVTYVTGLKQQIADLTAQLAAAGTDPAKLQAVKDGLTALGTTIDANDAAEAAIANTPAAT